MAPLSLGAILNRALFRREMRARRRHDEVRTKSTSRSSNAIQTPSSRASSQPQSRSLNFIVCVQGKLTSRPTRTFWMAVRARLHH
jgi:hypothetical protein